MSTAAVRSYIHADEPSFNMTSMIDVVFLLIVFFMSVMEMTKSEYESLVLPRATQAHTDDPVPPSRVVINIISQANLQNGQVRQAIIVRGKVFLTVDALKDYLQPRADAERNDKGESALQVKIRSDGAAPYSLAQKAMVACMKAGIHKVSIGAAPPERK